MNNLHWHNQQHPHLWLNLPPTWQNNELHLNKSWHTSDFCPTSVQMKDIQETDPWKWISYTKANSNSISFIQRNKRENTLLIRAPWPPLSPWVPNSVKVFGSDWMETSLEIDKRKWVSGYRDRTTSTHMTHVARAKKTRKEEKEISFWKTRSVTSLSCKREQKNCAGLCFRRCCWSVCLSCKQPHLQADCPLSHSLWSHYFLISLHSIVHYEFQPLYAILRLPTISKRAVLGSCISTVLHNSCCFFQTPVQKTPSIFGQHCGNKGWNLWCHR